MKIVKIISIIVIINSVAVLIVVAAITIYMLKCKKEKQIEDVLMESSIGAS